MVRDEIGMCEVIAEMVLTDNVITRVCKACQSHKLSGLTGRSCDGTNATFQGSNSSLENIDGRVPDTPVRIRR